MVGDNWNTPLAFVIGFECHLWCLERKKIFYFSVCSSLLSSFMCRKVSDISLFIEAMFTSTLNNLDFEVISAQNRVNSGSFK